MSELGKEIINGLTELCEDVRAGVPLGTKYTVTTYDRIRKLREEIGLIDFDIVKALRELRDDERS